MSTICNICDKNWCGCGGGNMCGACKNKLKSIEDDSTLSPEEKQRKIKEFYASNKST